MTDLKKKQVPSTMIEAETYIKTVSYNPVDKGWSWVILFCLFIVQTINIGFIRSFGVIFVHIAAKYNSTASFVSLIGALHAAAFSFSALFSLTVMLDCMTIRNVVLLGSFITSAGYALSFFVTSEPFYLLTLSLVGGGMSMSAGPGFVLLGSYFDKHRALAAAISNSGGSMGTLIIPPITQFLLAHFGLSNAFLIFGGIFAQCMVFASFYTPPSDYRPKTEGVDLPISPLPNDVKVSVDSSRSLLPVPRKISVRVFSVNYSPQEAGVLRSYLHTVESITTEDNTDLPFPARKASLSIRNLESDHTSMISINLTNQPSKIVTNLACISSLGGGQTLMLVGYEPLSDTAVKFHSEEEEQEEADNLVTVSTTQRCKMWSVIYDKDLFRSPLLWILLAYNSFGIMGVNMPSTYIPLLAREQGMTTETSSVLLSISGSLDFVSRLAPGFIVHMNWMKPQTLVMMGLVLMGIIFQFPTFYSSYSTMAFLSAVYGLCGGAFMSMLPLIVIDFVGLQHFPRAFGLAQLAFGFTVAPGYSILGYICDVTNTFKSAFHLIGASVLLSAATLLLETTARKRLQKKTPMRKLTQMLLQNSHLLPADPKQQQ